VTSRVKSGALPTELTVSDVVIVRTHGRNTKTQVKKTGQYAACAKRRRKPCFKETSVGVEPTGNCFAGSRLTVRLRRH
jgi:hypothetical protein